MNKRRLKRRLAEATRNERRTMAELHRLAREVARFRLALRAIPQPLVVRDEEATELLSLLALG